MAVIVIDLAIIAFFIAAPVLTENARYSSGSTIRWRRLVAADMIARLLASTDMLRLLQAADAHGSTSSSWRRCFPAGARQSRLPAHPAAAGRWRTAARWSHAAASSAGCNAGASRSSAVVNLLHLPLHHRWLRLHASSSSTAPGIEGYVDALYFTGDHDHDTGFGDITLPGIAGKLTSIITMIVGISLFVKLAQAMFRPAKVLA